MRDYDIESDLKQEKFQSIKLVQGDRGNKIKINVYEDGQPVKLTGCSITAKYKRADGEVVDGTVENKTDNYFYAVMDNNITKVAGTLKMLFNIENGDVKVSTFLLLADVREGIGENTGSSGGSTGGGSGEVTIDLSNYYKKIETYSRKEIDAQFKDITSKIENGNIGNNVEPELMDMPRIYFSEGTLPTSKTATMMKFDYYSKTTEYHGWVEIKCQGNSSMGYPKKNFTIKLYKDKAKTGKLKIDFKGWGKQSKFVLKANWIDLTHARNVVSARIWGDVVKSRAEYSSLPELLRTSPNQGAVDGFPVTVYGNGYYQGRYTLNIPKDKWMSNMDDTLDTHCILCGENYGSGCFRALPAISGADWTDELHDTVPAAIKTSWTNAIKFVMNSNDTEFKANLSNYFDVNSLLDYLLYGLISTGLDAFGKNQLYMTYDGIKWIASMYDMDSTWGLWWDGSRFVSNSYSREEFEDYRNTNKQGNLLYVRLQKLFQSQLKTRYAELRQNIFTYPYLVNKFEEFTQICPNDIVKEDYASTTANGAYTGIPSTTTNNIQQLRTNIDTRLTYVDSYINSLVEPVPCTAISLNKTTLSFTTTDTQTLTAILTPTITTDTVTWSVSPTGICMVNNGVVTPIMNGSCVITVTCGNQTATCNVSVSGIAKHYNITNTLTNCSTSNTKTTVEENSSYSATITANKGFALNNITVTMGGTDITNTSVLNGVITINSVTGDIIITADAIKIITGSTNLLEDITPTTNNSNLNFNITLEPGLYDLKNINNGTFNWLGSVIDGVNSEPGQNTTTGIRLSILKPNTPVTLHAYPNNIETNTKDKLGLYKVCSFTDTANKVSFTKQGNGYFTQNKTSVIVESDSDSYGYANIDVSKKYRFNLKSQLTSSQSMVCAIEDGFYFGWNQKTGSGCVLDCLDKSDNTLKGYFTGADKVWWSGKNAIGIDNVELIEIKVTEL